MQKSQFTDQQIAFVVQQSESWVAVEEVCRKLGSVSRPLSVEEEPGNSLQTVKLAWQFKLLDFQSIRWNRNW